MRRKKRIKSRRRKLILRIIILSIVILLGSGAFKAYDLYTKVLQTNVMLDSHDSDHLYIPTGSNFEDVCRLLSGSGIVRSINTFRWVAEKKNYPSHIHPGKYKIRDGMNNNQLVNLLRSGKQEPIDISFRNIKTLNELAGVVGSGIEADSTELINLFRNSRFISSYGFNKNTVLSMFIPNTYEFYWNTSAEEFFKRMAREYKTFWTEERLNKAGALSLSQSEVSTLASIVQAEQTIRPDERPKVAGLYINRLRKGMRLESDPTVIYALRRPGIKRVLNKDRKVESPYNTYRNKGLPPGPITLPTINSIDAVLNYEEHDFIFMCAREDFSGYHNFSRTNSEHNMHAARYRNELNKRKIYR